MLFFCTVVQALFVRRMSGHSYLVLDTTWILMNLNLYALAIDVTVLVSCSL